MSIVITDQILLSNIMTLEPRASNVVITGSTIKVESKWEYFSRVDINNRYIGLEVLMLYPVGSYPIDLFIQYCQNGTIRVSKYIFSNTTDLGFIPIQAGSVVIIDDLYTGGSTQALSAEQGVVLREMIEAVQPDTVWGGIVGNIQDQTDLITLINENSGGGAWGEIEGNIEDQLDLAERLNYLQRYNFMQ